MNTGKAHKLPLWKSWVEENRHRLKPGEVIEAKEIAEFLGVRLESWRFAEAMMGIVKMLDEFDPALMLNGWDGRSITGRKSWLIVPGDKQLKEAASRINRSYADIRRHVSTGMRLDRSIMPPEDVEKLDNMLDRASFVVRVVERSRRLGKEKFDAWKNSPITQPKRIKPPPSNP